MAAYLLSRLRLGVVTLLLVLLVTFVLIRLAPGDPTDAFLEEVRATQEQIALLRHQLGLDRPLPVQFAYYAGRVLKGEFGRSYLTREPVRTMIFRVFPFTLELAFSSTLLSIVVGIPLGILAARRRNTPFDYLSSAAAVTIYSMPRFWVGLLLILLFAVRYQWFPVIGVGDEHKMLDRLHHLVLPMLALGLSRVALLTRITRSAVLDVMQQDFIRTARSKGLAELRVTLHHTLRNALIPILTVIGLGLGHLIGGSVIVEAVFVRPGLGSLLVESIRGRDYPVAQGTIFFFAIGIVLTNIIVDILYGRVDPRIRYG